MSRRIIGYQWVVRATSWQKAWGATCGWLTRENIYYYLARENHGVMRENHGVKIIKLEVFILWLLIKSLAKTAKVPVRAHNGNVLLLVSNIGHTNETSPSFCSCSQKILPFKWICFLSNDNVFSVNNMMMTSFFTFIFKTFRERVTRVWSGQQSPLNVLQTVSAILFLLYCTVSYGGSTSPQFLTALFPSWS